jgi:anti-sigma factor (TIGR02949 family)
MNQENCKQVFSLLSDFIDGELPAELHREIEGHIAACDPCIEYLDSLKKTASMVRRFETEEKPSKLPAEVQALLLDAYRRSKRY